MAWMRRGKVHIHYDWIPSEDPDAEETLVLINGVGLDFYSWNFIIPYFKKGYHILRYDLRGHGKSDAGPEKRSIELLTHDLLFLISELNIRSYHLIGQGFGGFIGVHIAAEIPSNLKTLTLMSVPIHYPKSLGDQVTEQRKEKVKGEHSMLSMAQELVDKICLYPTDEKRRLLFNAYRSISPEVYFELFHTGFGEISAKKLQKINVPILLLSGSEDVIFPPELSSASLNFIPTARCYIIPDASFVIQMDQPQVTADWINKFITKNKNKLQQIDSFDENYQKHLTSQMYSEIRSMINGDINLSGSANSNELHVDIMNGLIVSLNGNRIVKGWSKRKAKQLLLYLVIQQSVTRDELCDVFWPESYIDNARNRLRVAIHHLKQLLEEYNSTDIPILVSDREHVFLQGKIKSDLLVHIEAIKKAFQIKDVHQKVDQFQHLLINKKENPLPGMYDDWFLDLRDWLEKKWVEMALFLADYYEEKKDVKNTIYYMEFVLKYDCEAQDLIKRLHKLRNQTLFYE